MLLTIEKKMLILMQNLLVTYSILVALMEILLLLFGICAIVVVVLGMVGIEACGGGVKLIMVVVVSENSGRALPHDSKWKSCLKLAK